MTTEPNSFLTVSSKEAALLYQTAANLQLQFLFRFYSYALQKSASCETKLGPDYMANFSPGINFSPVNRAEILLRLYDELQPGLKY